MGLSSKGKGKRAVVAKPATTAHTTLLCSCGQRMTDAAGICVYCIKDGKHSMPQDAEAACRFCCARVGKDDRECKTCGETLYGEMPAADFCICTPTHADTLLTKVCQAGAGDTNINIKGNVYLKKNCPWCSKVRYDQEGYTLEDIWSKAHSEADNWVKSFNAADRDVNKAYVRGVLKEYMEAKTIIGENCQLVLAIGLKPEKDLEATFEDLQKSLNVKQVGTQPPTVTILESAKEDRKKYQPWVDAMLKGEQPPRAKRARNH